MSAVTITWTPADPRSMPDAETNVLLGLSDGFSCEGFFDGEIWRDVTAMPIEDAKVVAWADMPMCGVAA